MIAKGLVAMGRLRKLLGWPFTGILVCELVRTHGAVSRAHVLVIQTNGAGSIYAKVAKLS